MRTVGDRGVPAGGGLPSGRVGPGDRVDPARVASPSYVADLIRAGAVHPSRRLGQNFLVDRNVLAHLVQVVDPAGAEVLEIGAGLGSLTLALAEAGAARVVAVEKDRLLAPLLGEAASGWPAVEVVEGDALELDWRSLVVAAGRENTGREGGAQDAGGRNATGPLVAGNLPYSVTSPLLFKLLEPPLFWPRAVVMVQLEVAQRILAKPGTKDYGALTLAVSAVAAATLAFKVGPRSFLPVPEVATAVLRLERHDSPAGGLDPDGLRHLAVVVRAAFGQRRKMVANALAAGLGLPRDEVAKSLASAGIDPARRGETLSLEEYLRLEKVLRSG